MIVMKGYEFSIFDPIDGEDSPETAILREIRPDYVEDHLSTSYLLGGEYLHIIHSRSMR